MSSRSTLQGSKFINGYSLGTNSIHERLKSTRHGVCRIRLWSFLNFPDVWTVAMITIVMFGDIQKFKCALEFK